MPVNIQGPEANASETQADDAIAADVAATIAIAVQPADASVAVGDAMTVSVTATSTPPGNSSLLTFQWQKKEGNRFKNISGATAYQYQVASHAAENAGTYRVKINSTNGASEVISDNAVITTA